MQSWSILTMRRKKKIKKKSWGSLLTPFSGPMNYSWEQRCPELNVVFQQRLCASIQSDGKMVAEFHWDSALRLFSFKAVMLWKPAEALQLCKSDIFCIQSLMITLDFSEVICDLKPGGKKKKKKVKSCNEDKRHPVIHILHFLQGSCCLWSQRTEVYVSLSE